MATMKSSSGRSDAVNCSRRRRIDAARYPSGSVIATAITDTTRLVLIAVTIWPSCEELVEGCRA